MDADAYSRMMESSASGSDPGECSHYSPSSPDSSSPIDHEVTPGSLEIWSDLPDEIKNDPSLAPFKDQYERQHGPAVSVPLITSTPAEVIEDISKPEETPKSRNGSCLQLSDARLNQNGHGDSVPFSPFIPTEHRPSLGYHRESSGSIFGRDPPRVSFISSNMSRDHPGNKSRASIVSTPETIMEETHDAVTGHKKMKPWIRHTKVFILLLCWVVFTCVLMMKNEKVDASRQISVPENKIKSYFITEDSPHKKLTLHMSGPFLPEQYGNMSVSWLRVWVDLVQLPWEHRNYSMLNKAEAIFIRNLTDVWSIPLVGEEILDYVPDVKRKHTFELAEHNKTAGLLRVAMTSSMSVGVPITMSCDPSPIDVRDGILYAAIVLLGLYILIVFEIVHRTFAAMLASTMSVAILAALDERPSTSELISWIDVETLLLLFSMMVLVAILSETGIFDYLAVYAYKVTGGRVWPLINYLCLFTAVMSSFLDNVTTVLLMTPVTIRLCEVMDLNPVPILMAMIIYSNVGGTLTPVGDPPNVIIASNSEIIKAGIDFTTFTMHMSIGILLVAVQTYIHLRLYFRNINSLRHSEPQHLQELRHEISIWQRAAASLSSYSKDEDLVRETLLKKVNRLLAQLKRKVNSGTACTETYQANLEHLTLKYPIRNRVLLVKSTIAVLFVIIVFFLHSVPELQRLSLGWTALLGALLLLILADRDDMEAVLARVEWSTLLFFAALFILMEALSKLGLIDWIGKQTENVILSVSEESRLAVAILLILWVSAVASAFVDNIPLTTMMIRIATSLGNNPTLNLPLQPLVWALAFGACLGGNGTLIGASANVVCAGVAEQHGYRFSFVEYFKVGFPVMLGSVSVITVYLLVSHVLLQWH